MQPNRRRLLVFVIFGAALVALTIDRPRTSNPGALIPTVQRASMAALEALVDKVPRSLADTLREAGALARLTLPDRIQPQGMNPDLPFRMVFPHAPAGTGGGLTIQSSVIILNNSGANAEGTIFFYLNSGSPMSVETTMGTGSSFNFTLLPGEELRLETLEQRATRTGWIEVLSNVQLAGSGTFSVFQGASFVSEVGIADSPSSTSTLLYVDTTDGKDTGFALCNPHSDRSLNYQIEVRRLNGTVVASTQGSLPPRGQTAQFVTGVNAGLTNFQGVLVISSSDEFAVVTLRTRGLFFTSFPVAPRVEDVSDDDSLLFARLANGVSGDLRIFSTFQLMNNSDSVATSTLRFFGENGQNLNLTIGGQTGSEITLQVPANSAVELVSAGAGPAVVGWARVESSIPLAGGAAFTIVNASSGVFVSEVGIPDSAVSPRQILFAEVRGDIDTGVALTNVGERPIRVRLRLVGGQPGATAMTSAAPAAVNAVTEIDLTPGQHIAQFVSQLFASEGAVAMRDFRGRLEMVARDVELSAVVGFDLEVPMGGIALRTRGPLLTSLPVAPYVLNFHPILDLSLATRLAGASPRTCLNWRQQAGERGIRTATIQFNRGRLDLSRLPDETQFAGDLVAGVPLFGVVNFGSLLFTDVTATEAVFYGPLSVGPDSEAASYNGTIRNLPGDGFEVVLTAGPPETEPAILPIPGFIQICMDSGLVQLSNLPGATVTVSEEYLSMDMMTGAMDALRRSVSNTFQIETPSGPVEIHSVLPGRIQGNGEIEVLGTGFAATPAGNRVTVEANSRVEAEVLEASSSRLRVRLPHGTARGPLRVEAGGRQSNDYALEVAFAPTIEVMFQNPSRGQPTGFSATLNQQAGEIFFEELLIDPGTASWITGGFAVDQVLGQLTIRQFVDTPGVPEETDTYELRVIQSGSGQLQVGAFESGDDDPTLLVNLMDGGSLILSPAVTEFTFVHLAAVEATLRFDQAVMMLPASGSSVSFGVTLHSQPERLARPGTRRTVEQTRQAAIN